MRRNRAHCDVIVMMTSCTSSRSLPDLNDVPDDLPCTPCEDHRGCYRREEICDGLERCLDGTDERGCFGKLATPTGSNQHIFNTFSLFAESRFSDSLYELNT